jgi:hypothetical protein
VIGVYHLPNIQTRHPTLDAGFGFLRAVVTNSSQAPCQVRGDGDGRERVKRTSVETILRGIVSALSTSAPSASHRYPLLAQPVSICHRNCMAKERFRIPLSVPRPLGGDRRTGRRLQRALSRLCRRRGDRILAGLRAAAGQSGRTARVSRQESHGVSGTRPSSLMR